VKYEIKARVKHMHAPQRGMGSRRGVKWPRPGDIETIPYESSEPLSVGSTLCVKYSFGVAASRLVVLEVVDVSCLS